VQSVKADLATKKVEIAFDAPASEDEIKGFLAEIEYPSRRNVRVGAGLRPAPTDRCNMSTKQLTLPGHRHVLRQLRGDD